MMGNYTELRYAKNGSTTTAAKSLHKASLCPAGWSTTMPSVGSLEYLWMTSAVKSADGNTLVQQWATPVRVSPYDGKDGKSRHLFTVVNMTVQRPITAMSLGLIA